MSNIAWPLTIDKNIKFHTAWYNFMLVSAWKFKFDAHWPGFIYMVTTEFGVMSFDVINRVIIVNSLI
jgi:hypothetical protein